MALNSPAWILSNAFTKATAEEFGAVKGANCQVGSTSYDEDGNTMVDFLWKNADGVQKTTQVGINRGLQGVSILGAHFNSEGKLVIELDNETELLPLDLPTATVDISEEEGNALEIKEDGLYVPESSGGGGSSTLSADLTSNVEVGGCPSGTKFVKNTNLEDIIKKILVKYNAPGATFSINPSTTLKLFGQTIATETLKVVAVKNSYDITEIVFRVGNTELEKITTGVASGGTFTHAYTPENPIAATTTFYVDVKDGEKTTTKSVTITFCYPTYYGTVADTVTSMDAAAIQALSNRDAINGKGKTWSGITMTYGKLCYAYPKSFGALSSIKDANNVDYINSYTRTEVTLTENGTSVVYYCYLLKDATGVSNFKQVYA